MSLFFTPTAALNAAIVQSSMDKRTHPRASNQTTIGVDPGVYSNLIPMENNSQVNNTQANGVSGFQQWLMDNLWTAESQRQATDKANRLQEEWTKQAQEWEAQQAVLNREFQLSSAREAMQFESDQVQRQMDFQERMSNTSYQRAAADLKAAGLNPILAYAQPGASTPSGAAGSGSAASGSAASGKLSNTKVAQISSNLQDLVGSAVKLGMLFPLTVTGSVPLL